MSKLLVVKNDSVEGTDKHNVSGTAKPPPPGEPYIGVGEFDYVGKMTDQLSDFVKIDGSPAALIISKSSLNPGEDVTPTGKHSGPKGNRFVPAAPPPIKASLKIEGDPIGEGNPSDEAGSSFLRIDGDRVLLDGDPIDTCDGLGNVSTVTAEHQDFVSASE